VSGKRWVTVGDDAVEEICLANEDQGVIDLDEDFDSGDDAPPAHPNCRCWLEPVLVGDDEKVAKYSDDQLRDERGRWTDSGAVSLEPTDERAWSGEQEPNATRLGKQEAGKLGEQISLAYVQSLPGHEDARALNDAKSNFPVDAIGDHEVFEVKTGQVTNSKNAQQWRATIGQPGKAQAIMDRKQAAVDAYAKALDHPINGKTITVLIHPDKGIADVHVYDGFHQRIGYNSETAKNAYVGTFRYTGA